MLCGVCVENNLSKALLPSESLPLIEGWMWLCLNLNGNCLGVRWDVTTFPSGCFRLNNSQRMQRRKPPHPLAPSFLSISQWIWVVVLLPFGPSVTQAVSQRVHQGSGGAFFRTCTYHAAVTEAQRCTTVRWTQLSLRQGVKGWVCVIVCVCVRVCFSECIL